MEKYYNNQPPLRLTQHKRFALRAHPNPRFARTSDTRQTLCAIAIPQIQMRVLIATLVFLVMSLIFPQYFGQRSE